MSTITILTDCHLATMQANGNPYGLIPNGAMVMEDRAIVWVGAHSDLPTQWASDSITTRSAGGRLVTPGLIDCHTHLVYAGNRANEFEMRLNGANYEDISRAGGGIVSTVNATRAASVDDLIAQTTPRLQGLINECVTTLEIKSGYVLSLDSEKRCLIVARTLAKTHPVQIQTTFLGAHAVPPEFAGRSDDYIDEVLRMMPVLHSEGLVDAVDAFCEHIGFSAAQTQRVFELAQSLNIPVKLHAEQLSDSGGSALAASYKALSCDHLEWLSESGAKAMASAGTTAVLLPGAYYFLRETKMPPIELLRREGVGMAIATDSNPGTSPCTSILLMLNMACTLFRLTPEEALRGVTQFAANALGLNDRGVLAPGMRADAVIWNVSHPAQLSYAFGANPRHQTIFAGQFL